MSVPLDESNDVEEKDNQPIARKRFDRVDAAIWRRESNRDDGPSVWYQSTIHRSYRDRDGKWQRTNSFTERDLPHVKLAADWAMSELLMKRD